MPDFDDTSRIPDDPAYWDALAQRVAATAVRESKSSGFEWLSASRAGWVAASILLGAALLSMAAALGRSADGRDSDLVRAIAPADDMGKAIAVSENPPAIGALMVQTRGGT